MRTGNFTRTFCPRGERIRTRGERDQTSGCGCSKAARNASEAGVIVLGIAKLQKPLRSPMAAEHLARVFDRAKVLLGARAAISTA